MNCGIWYMGLLSVDQCSIWSVFLLLLFCFFILIYSLKFKMTQNRKQGVKSDPGLTPLIFGTGPTKMHLQHYKLPLPIENHHQTHLFALLIEERFAWYLIDFFPFKMYVVFCTTRNLSERQSEAGGFDHWCFPAHAAWLGLKLLQCSKWFGYLQQCNK